MRQWVLAGLSLLLLALSGATWAQGAPAKTKQSAVAATEGCCLSAASQRLMRATGSGRDYQIYIAMPKGPAPAAGYAVMYVLDGDAMFHTMVDTVRAYERRPDGGEHTRAVVVGIGYPPGTDIPAARTLDMTPIASDEPRVLKPNGGADAFLAFVEDELKPAIAREINIDPQRQALFGHSFGGLFALHALTKRPGSFQTYIAASPSLWYADAYMAKRVAQFATGNSSPPPLRVLLTAGEYEQTLSPNMARRPEAGRVAGVLKERAQVQRSRTAADQLSALPGTLAVAQEIAGEDHGTVIPSAIGRGVAFFLAGPVLPPVPDAQAYLKMTAEQRYQLRLDVRDLPDSARIPWLNRLKKTLQDGLTKEQREMLHAERNRMDQEQGTKPHLINAD